MGVDTQARGPAGCGFSAPDVWDMVTHTEATGEQRDCEVPRRIQAVLIYRFIQPRRCTESPSSATPQPIGDPIGEDPNDTDTI